MKKAFNPTVINGVEVTKLDGKFHFSAKPNGQPYTMIQSGRIGEHKAEQIAKAIGASVKRGFKGHDIDPMAAGAIRKIVAMPTFKGIDFTQCGDQPR